jgi:hypothetical protein
MPHEASEYGGRVSFPNPNPRRAFFAIETGNLGLGKAVLVCVLSLFYLHSLMSISLFKIAEPLEVLHVGHCRLLLLTQKQLL